MVFNINHTLDYVSLIKYSIVMKFLDEKTGRVVEVKNDVLFEYCHQFRLLRNFVQESLTYVPATTTSGEICLIHFDFIDKLLDEFFKVDTISLCNFVKQLYVASIDHLNCKLCEEEEDLEDGVISFRYRQYPIRKIVSVKPLNLKNNEKVQVP